MLPRFPHSRPVSCAISCTAVGGGLDENLCFFMRMRPDGICESGAYDANIPLNPGDPTVDIYEKIPGRSKRSRKYFKHNTIFFICIHVELSFGVLLGAEGSINDTLVIGANGKECTNHRLPQHPSPNNKTVANGAVYGEGFLYLCGGVLVTGPTATCVSSSSTL